MPCRTALILPRGWSPSGWDIAFLGFSWDIFITSECRSGSRDAGGSGSVYLSLPKEKHLLVWPRQQLWKQQDKIKKPSPLPSLPSQSQGWGEWGGPNATPAPLRGAWTPGRSRPSGEKLLGLELGKGGGTGDNTRGTLQSLSATRLSPGRPRQCLHPRGGGAEHPHLCHFPAQTSPACAGAPRIHHTAACVTLAAIKRFKQQFLTFMNKWPWMDDSGSIQFPARKCQQKPGLFHVGG